jgi:RNA polymerase-interacting CarD/CdnL/TRCF family regulator
MEFIPGDAIVHPSYGVGNIVRLENRQLAEIEMRRYYVLAFGTMTVWIPVHADGSTILRAVTAKQDLEQYRTLLKSCPAVLERDHKKRRSDIYEQLTHGSFRVMCEVVRDLTALGWFRTMGEVDSTILKKVRDNLWREWAVATGLPLMEVVLEVNGLLQAGEQAHKASMPVPVPVSRRG